MSFTKWSHRPVAVAVITVAGLMLAGAFSSSPATAATDVMDNVEVTGAQTVHLQAQADDGPEANLPFLFAVYIVTWAGFFAYAFFMSRRQRDMQREIDALKRIVGEHASQRDD